MSASSEFAGWKLDRSERAALLERFPPRYATPVADHVTFALDPARLPPEAKIVIVGRADDDAGVEAMIVTVDGSVDRADGSTYHITWSLEDGRRAVESNDVLRERGWKELDHPVPVTATPARIR